VVHPPIEGRRQDVASTPITPGKPDLTSPAKGQDFGSDRRIAWIAGVHSGCSSTLDANRKTSLHVIGP
jgi:hypothetical protein